MTPQQRRWVLISGGLATVVVVAIGVVMVLPGDSGGSAPPANAGEQSPAAPPPSIPEQVADQFLSAFRLGDAQTAGTLTDAPAEATRQLTAVWTGLRPKTVTAPRSKPVEPAGEAATAAFRLTWTFGAERTWAYDSTLPLAKVDGRWRVHWTPALVHPKLTAEKNLALLDQTGQVAVLDRGGAPLLVWQAAGPKAAEEGLAPLLTPAMARVAAEQGGKDGWHVALVDATGRALERLAGSDGQSKPITSTLSIDIQRAAQAAVDSAGRGAMLVAIQPSTGDVLAVAQNSAAGTDPVVLHGQYPPGSTFKIATATAVLQSGAADLNTVLACPGEIRVGQRTIPNDDHFSAGDVPLHTAFARSCNTTFAKLASDLPADGLSRAASELGLNADFVLPGFITEAGKVEPAGSTTQRVEDGIGQGRVGVSPFGVALMTATVAIGRALTPKLWRELPTTVTAGYQAPPRAILDKVRTMMREVITGGTGRSLAGRGQVYGKTGTAQFGSDGTHSHGWFTGFRGDLAFAVLVLSGETSAPALSISSKFLAAV